MSWTIYHPAFKMPKKEMLVTGLKVFFLPGLLLWNANKEKTRLAQSETGFCTIAAILFLNNDLFCFDDLSFSIRYFQDIQATANIVYSYTCCQVKDRLPFHRSSVHVKQFRRAALFISIIVNNHECAGRVGIYINAFIFYIIRYFVLSDQLIDHPLPPTDG